MILALSDIQKDANIPVICEFKSSHFGIHFKYSAEYWILTFFAILNKIKITWSKSDLRSDQDHDLEFPKKVI